MWDDFAADEKNEDDENVGDDSAAGNDVQEHENVEGDSAANEKNEVDDASQPRTRKKRKART